MFVAVRSFAAEGTANECKSRLEGMGIPCSILSKHPRLMDRVWLFVPGDRDIYVRQTLAAFPPEAIEKSVDLVGIEEWEIPDYAVKAVNREGRERSLLFFLLVFLWPVSFGLTNIWTYISFALMVVVVAAVTKAMMSCPCCRRLSLRKAESGNTVQCLECGISGDKSTE